MAKQVVIRTGTVREIENSKSYRRDEHTGELVNDYYNGLRIRVQIEGDDVYNKNGITDYSMLPWCFPLLPKVFQSIPKEGEEVLVFVTDLMASTTSQRYYIGPIISQPQFNTYCPKKNATSLIKKSEEKPLEPMDEKIDGAFPKPSDVAIIGRGKEDIILRYGVDGSSEIELRAGIRGEPKNDLDENAKGNIIFNGVDPAYIQLKHKSSLTASESLEANSVINIVADRINIMSNKDNNIADNIKDKDSLIKDGKLVEVMKELQPVPLGDNLFDFLQIVKMAILHHVHPWAGMEQCGDWGGWIKELEKFPLEKILSNYVRIS